MMPMPPAVRDSMEDARFMRRAFRRVYWNTGGVPKSWMVETEARKMTTETVRMLRALRRAEEANLLPIVGARR